MASSIFRGPARVELAGLSAEQVEELRQAGTTQLLSHTLRYIEDHEPDLCRSVLRAVVEGWVSELDAESLAHFCGTAPGASYDSLKGAAGVMTELALIPAARQNTEA